MSLIHLMNMFEPLGSFILEKMIELLPSWIARHIVSPDKVAREIEIDLGSSNPIQISFGSEVPRLSIYFRISNLSRVDVTLDRMLVDVWFGQPTLQGAILRRYQVAKRTSEDNVHFVSPLSTPQQEQIKKQINGQLISSHVRINTKAYFDSKIGIVHLEKTFERTNVPCRG